MTYKFELNADLRQVWLRLAGNFKAGMAESERSLRTGEYAGENPATGSMFDEDEQESE